MRIISGENYYYLGDKIHKCVFVFSNSEMGQNINFEEIEGCKNHLTALFPIKDIGYIKQCHSDKVFEYSHKIHDGDALYTGDRKIAVGVFTADCVPVLIYDKKLKLVAAVHSGWRGTYDRITTKTINQLIKEKGSGVEDLVIYIGPHIHHCCYEISNELKSKFLSSGVSEKAFIGNNLSLSLIIKEDLMEMGISHENIYEADFCTKCSNKIRFHSYRRDKELSGRNFSFVFIED